MKILVGSLGMVGDMVKDMVKRKHKAAMCTDRSFQDSPRHHSSHTIMAWPSKNRRASRALRKNVSGTVNEVDNERTQARSSRRAFIWNKVKSRKCSYHLNTGNKFFHFDNHSVHHHLTRIDLQAGWA